MQSSINQIATALQVTPEQIKNQLKKNAAGLLKMAEKAKALGKKVNGYTEAELRDMAAAYENKSK